MTMVLWFLSFWMMSCVGLKPKTFASTSRAAPVAGNSWWRSKYCPSFCVILVLFIRRQRLFARVSGIVSSDVHVDLRAPGRLHRRVVRILTFSTQKCYPARLPLEAVGSSGAGNGPGVPVHSDRCSESPRKCLCRGCRGNASQLP